MINFNVKKALVALLVSFSASLNAQNAPAIEWIQDSWEPTDPYGNPQAQTSSGEDWWYTNKNVYDALNNHIGYITAGYSSIVVTASNYPIVQSLINEGPNSCYNPIGNYPTGSCNTYDFSTTCPEGCVDRDYIGEHRTQPRGTVAFNDLKGNISWFKEYTDGEIGEVIQDGNNFYIIGVHAGAKPYHNTSSFLAYNPSPANPSSFFDISSVPSLVCTPTNQAQGYGLANHIYIAKLDMSGNIIWQGLYGIPDYNVDPNNAMHSGGWGYDLIRSSNGNIFACGYSQQTPTAKALPFVLQLDPTNGYVISERVMPAGVITSASGFTSDQGAAHSIVELGTTQTYALACNYLFPVPPSPSNYSDYHEAVIWIVDNSLNPASTVTQNLIHIPGTDPSHRNSNIWEVNYHQAKQELLAPVITNCTTCAYAGDNSGVCKIYRYTNAGILSTVGTNPSTLGNVLGFDLRAGTVETPDGGFISVSTTKTTTTTYTSSDLGYLNGCSAFVSPSSLFVWDADPLVGKFDVNGNLQWTKTFDIVPGRPRTPPLGDTKRQECMYKVSVAQDGGYVCSGNTSYNFDDNYLFKLYNDCNVTQPYDKKDPTNVINITTPTTWSSPHKVIGSVHVKAPNTLTITGVGAVIEFADTKLTGILTNIVVERGATLTVKNGARLTSIQNCPNSMWDGVILQGTALAQTPLSNQGVGNFSGGTIENARLGVSVGNNPSGGNNGAILRANGFKFRNNDKDVAFNPYTSPSGNPNNKSYFLLCNFLGDLVLNDPDYFTVIPGNRRTTSTHVSLNQVTGINFSGCTFKTDLTNLPSGYVTDGRSTGIYSTNAIFSVQSYCTAFSISGCTSSIPSSFENLYYGIYAQSTNPLKTFTSTECQYTNCYASLYESGINYSTVTKNNFLINAIIPQPTFAINFCGPFLKGCPNYFHYLNQCNGFTHQENNFTTTITGSQKTIGTIFNKTSSSSSLTYRNNYSGLYNGVQTQTNNTRLQIQCNQNSGVSNADIITTSGILPNQGACTLLPTSPANNTFSHYSSSLSSDFNYNNSAAFLVYHMDPNPPGGSQVPIYINNVNPVGCFGLPPYNYTLGCPSMLSSDCNIPCQLAKAVGSGNIAISLRAPLILGNSASLYIAIQSNMNQGALKVLLMSQSPYLSDSVLISYMLRSNTPSPGNVKDVIVANSPVSTRVMQVISSLSLPRGIMNNINSAQTGVSRRQELQDEVDYYFNQKQFSIDRALSLVINDTVLINRDSLIKAFLILDGSLTAKADLANLLIESGDYASAQSYIDDVKASPELLKKGNFLQHYKDLCQQGKNWNEINTDANLLTDVTVLAFDSLSDGFGNARSVLGMVKGLHNYEFIESENNNHNNNRMAHAGTGSENANENISENDLMLKAFPNPFKDELTVITTLPDNETEARIQLIEPATGRILIERLVLPKQQTTLFNTSNLPGGMYIISVKGSTIAPKFIRVINLK